MPDFPPMRDRVREHARRLLEEREPLGYDQEADGVLSEAIDSFVESGWHGNEVFDRQKFLAAVAAGEVVVGPVSQDVGELGLSYSVVGSVAQSLGVAAYERGEVTRDQVVAYMTGPKYDEDELWNMLGPWIDEIENGASRVVEEMIHEAESMIPSLPPHEADVLKDDLIEIVDGTITPADLRKNIRWAREALIEDQALDAENRYPQGYR